MGAIVRGPESLMVVQDIRTWDRPGSDPMEREIRYVERVRSALGIDRALCAPPRAAKRDGTVVGWIPALRFPIWTRCMGCGLLHSAPWRDRGRAGGGHHGKETESGGRVLQCSDCGGRLEQVPWVFVHEDGYLADAPWHDLAHGGARDPEQRQCSPDWTEPYLKLGETVAGRRILCTRCNSSGEVRHGAMPRHPFPPRTWQQPWFREPPAESPEELGWLTEINDVRVHTPLARTALVIPPESRIHRGTVLDRLYGSSRNQERIRKARNALARKGAIRRLASELRCGPQDIEDAMSEIDRGYPLYGRAITAENLLADEYRALIEEIPDLREDEDFVTEHHTEDWSALGRTLETRVAKGAAGTVSRLVGIHRLKEIMVLTGFQARRRRANDAAGPHG